MKLLYIDIYDDYMNFSGKYLLSVMKNLEVNFFGPGFSNELELQMGLESYIEKYNGFDIIISGLLLVEDKNLEDIRKSYINYSKYRYLYFKESDYAFIKNIKDVLINLKDVKILYKFGMDSYNIESKLLDLLKEANVYTLVFGKQFVKKIDKKENLSEKFKKDINNNFYDFVNTYDNKIISFNHTIGEDEFKYNSLQNRTYNISILGVLYKSRQDMLLMVKKLKYSQPTNVHRLIFSFFNKLGINVYSNYITMNIYNLIFRYYLFQSKFSYTDGSELDLPIRKFFEIPANGSVLIAKETLWFEALGFQNKKNFIQIEQDSDIIDILEFYLANIEITQAIADNGQKLIYENHSTVARTHQLKQCFEAILNNNFNGTEWIDGKFIVREKYESR